MNPREHRRNFLGYEYECGNYSNGTINIERKNFVKSNLTFVSAIVDLGHFFFKTKIGRNDDETTCDYEPKEIEQKNYREIARKYAIENVEKLTEAVDQISSSPLDTCVGFETKRIGESPTLIYTAYMPSVIGPFLTAKFAKYYKFTIQDTPDKKGLLVKFYFDIMEICDESK